MEGNARYVSAVILPQVAAGPRSSEGLRCLELLPWLPAHEICRLTFRPSVPYQSLSLAGLGPAIFLIGPESLALEMHHPR